MYTAFRTKPDELWKCAAVFIQQSALITFQLPAILSQYGLPFSRTSKVFMLADKREFRNYSRYGRPSEKASKLSPQQVLICVHLSVHFKDIMFIV